MGSGMCIRGRAEDVALRVGQGIEPSPPLVDDDDDLGPASILDRFARAFFHVDRKAGLLKHDCARNTVPHFFKFVFLHYPAGALASAFLSGFFISRSLRDRFRRSAKSKGGKGAAGNQQIYTSAPAAVPAAAKLPLPPAARKRHLKRGRPAQ